MNITSRVVNGWTAFDVGDGMIHNYPILPIPEGTAARAVVAKAIS
ncbi:putative esterase [Leifsonia rubra CMS 76R]|nr:putative esterase [Leifsonia rubra CMS 76R]